MFRWLARMVQRTGHESAQPGVAHGQFIYSLPYQPGRSFRVVQGYGGSYSHQGETHFSLDFAMPECTDVCAARSGVIYHVTNHFSEGGTHPSYKPKSNAVCILHTDDTIATYAHLSQRGSTVRPGDAVTVGQVIGYSGNTGWSGMPHLHFHVADAFFHRRIPTKFHTKESGVITLEVSRSYTSPPGQNRHPIRCVPGCLANDFCNDDRHPFAFCDQLFELAANLESDLSSGGFERIRDYSSIEAMHDVYGLEVCGIHHPEVALEITRFLLRRFPGWNAGWLHAPDHRSPDQWVASIQRDRNLTMEYWETD